MSDWKAAKIALKLASEDPWGADIQNSAEKRVVEAKTLAYYISSHNDFAYQSTIKHIVRKRCKWRVKICFGKLKMPRY